MPNIYFIIVTYNAMKWAEKCIGSIGKSNVVANVIVVDNGSTDGTQDFIKNNFPAATIIQNSENLGFGKANNLGIEAAYKKGADFFYLMNQDAWIYPDTLQKLYGFYTNHSHKEEIGILSPIHLDGTEKNIEIFVEKYLAHNALKERIFTDLMLQNSKKGYEVDFVNAAHWFLPKDTIEKVGGFNPYFFHYGEDNEYVNRIIFKKKKTILVKDCFAVHDGNQDLSKVNYTHYLDTKIDTKILNPNYKKAEILEKKSLKQSILKNYITGNTTEAKKLKSVLKRINSNLPELLQSKEILMTTEHPFLKL